jgi:hypothetical protein
LLRLRRLSETRSDRPATTLLLIQVNHPVDDFLTGYEVSSSRMLWKSHGRCTGTTAGSVGFLLLFADNAACYTSFWFIIITNLLTIILYDSCCI